ncbi:MAG: SUMF1/EgtB/PvdO family nonheme iron enzyme [Magnetococcales bacterium]|nr:SUMF1/EgtB/PvdO family nonheme iron enzyme [Magnetococcales bacterium]
MKIKTLFYGFVGLVLLGLWVVWAFFIVPPPPLSPLVSQQDQSSRFSLDSASSSDKALSAQPEQASGPLLQPEVKRTAILKVESIPQGAKVLLDGGVLGVTPVMVEKMALGQYRLKLEKVDYSYIEVALNLQEDTVVNLSLDLIPLSNRPTRKPLSRQGRMPDVAPVLDRKNQPQGVNAKPKRKQQGQEKVQEQADGLWIEPNTGISFVSIPDGCFTMGSETGGMDERPEHRVCLDAYKIGRYEVTQKEWIKVMGEENNPSHFTSKDTLPVDSVSWSEANRFIQKLNTLGSTVFRLPTEAEWEYACRGEEGGRGDWITPEQANYRDGSASSRQDGGRNQEGTAPVGSFQPNGFGLYDMHGNVYEWSQDWYEKDKYANSAEKNPISTNDSSFFRLLRGGAWYSNPSQLRCSYRYRGRPGVQNNGNGIRLVVSNFR